MSQDSRADQIAFHLYTKLFSVVSQARTTSEPRSQPKVDRWFNLETPESELFSKDAKEPYKSVSQNPPPPLEIQVLLAVPDLAHTNQGLVLRLPDTSRTRIHPPPPYILLESYTMSFTAGPGPADVPLPTIYKAGIPLFRSLFTLLRLLPTWKLHKRLRRRAGVGPALAIVLRVGTDSSLGFGVDGVPPLETQTHAFTEVPHPMGAFVLSVRYLSTPAFQLDELESLLSSRFMSMDERPFVPTLARRADPSPPAPVPAATALADRFLLPSAGSSPGRGIPLPLPDRQLASGSLPRRQVSLSRPSTATGQHRLSPNHDLSHRPSPSNLEATRTMLRQESAHHRTSSASSSLSPTNSFFTPMAPPSNLTLNTNIPPSSSSSSSIPPSTTAMTAMTTTPTTATQGQGQTPPRRPVFPFPFKSNTLASSSVSAGGLGSQPSSLNDRVSIHDRMAGLNERRSVDLAFSPATSAAPIPHAQTTANTPITATASAGDDQATASTTTTTLPTRKRYSSSFGHRYVSGGLPGSAGSAGSGASGGPGSLGAGNTSAGSALAGGECGSLSRSRSTSRRPSHGVSGLGIQVPARRVSPQQAEFPRSRNLSMDPQHSPGRANSFLAGHTDDDDISVFVQSIDMRKPLVGRGREREERERRDEERERERERKGRESSRWGEGGAQERGEDEQEQGERPRGRNSHSRVGRGAVGSPPLAPARAAALDSARGTVASPPGMRTALSSPPTSTPAAAPVSPRQRTTAAVGSPPAGLMLTSEREVDERLRRMNEVFFKSLEGLGGGMPRAGRGSGALDDGEGGRGGGSRSRSGSNEGTGGERERTTGFGHFRSTSGGGGAYRVGAEAGSGGRRSESPFRSSGGGGSRRDVDGSHAYLGSRAMTDRAPLAMTTARNDGGRGAFLDAVRREGSLYAGGGVYPSVFARSRSGASRDRSEEVIGRLEFDYEGGGGGGLGVGGRERSGR